jgi:hypothetical protein
MWLAIGIVAIVAALIAAFILRSKKIGPFKPKDTGATVDQFLGLDINYTRGYRRPGSGMFYIKEDRDFPATPEGEALRAKVYETIDRAIRDERATAKHYHPDWNIPSIEDSPVMVLPPMYYTEVGNKPGLLVQSFARSNDSSVPSSEKIPTAGTVLNYQKGNTPTPGSGANPFIVVADHFEFGWEDMEWLYVCVYNESEHLTERWQSYEEFLKFSGTNDFHPHRQPVGVEAHRSTAPCCGAMA